MKKLLVKFKHAFEGLFHGLLHDKSIGLQYLLALVAVLSFILFFDLNQSQWLFIVIVIMLVIAFEYMNSAIENVVDLVVDHYDERAKHAKDYAAAAVLIISILAVVVAGFILL